MAIIKAYTDLGQSKVLAEFLPIESADMFYATETSTLIAEPPYEVEGYKPCIPFIPAWSLASLLNILPRVIDLDTYHTFLDIYPTKNLGWVIEYSNSHDIIDFSFNNENLIDACMEMILKLHKLKIL